MEKNVLIDLVGKRPIETGLIRRARFHQGWWRAFILNEAQGSNPGRKEDSVCNTISSGEISGKNFLTTSAITAIQQTKEERKAYEAGLFNEDRLFNNLLSSQPLAFNFFGELKQDPVLARKLFSAFIPELSKVTNVFFEFAPKEKFTGDNSAFDVAIEFERSGLKGILGLECKYTDSFSKKEYDRETYKSVFLKSGAFSKPYEKYIESRFNQLFRGQLIAEALVQNEKYDVALTGLFCFHEDSEALETGRQFQSMLNDGNNIFKIITYSDFISALQKLDLTWEQREWSMLLWSRYCGMKLSEGLFGFGTNANTAP